MLAHGAQRAALATVCKVVKQVTGDRDKGSGTVDMGQETWDRRPVSSVHPTSLVSRIHNKHGVREVVRNIRGLQ